jgi:hypothetical protein
MVRWRGAHAIGPLVWPLSWHALGPARRARPGPALLAALSRLCAAHFPRVLVFEPLRGLPRRLHTGHETGIMLSETRRFDADTSAAGDIAPSTNMLGICEEQDAPDLADRCAEPCLQTPAPKPVGVVEDGGMKTDMSPRRCRPRQNEEARGAAAPPAEPLGGEAPGETHLLVVLPQRRLDREQLGLDLDDEERAGLGVIGQDVDRAGLTSKCIGRFDLDRPADSPQSSRRRGDQLSVAGIEQPIQLAAAPSHADLKLCIERSKDARESPNPDSIGMAALDERHDLLA